MKATMSLPQACAALGKSYNATMRLIFIRELRGEQRGGRWFVDPNDVARMRERRDRRQPAVSAIAGQGD